MRILRLDLTAFGSFTEIALDFSSDPCLHVVYGPNEAGKSTALRALTGLLFGIPRSTPDAHQHPMPKLRVGALLESATGERLEVVRRKGEKNTLLDAAGDPLDDAVLDAMLRGVTRERFVTMFGLDHESLREGAQALLEDRGDVGESLFDAGSGGRGIHAVLAGLEREAEQIFAPRASTRALNAAIRDFKDARKRSNDATLRAAAWRDQTEAIDSLRERVASLTEQKLERTREARRARRLVAVIPLLHKRAELLRRCEGLGGDDAVDRLLALPEDVVEDLRNRLGSHRKAQIDRPKLEADLAAAEKDARRRLRGLGDPVPLENVESLRIDVARIARIRALPRRRDTMQAKLDGAIEKRDELKSDLERLQRRLGELPRRFEETATPKLEALPLWNGSLEQAQRLVTPSLETVDRFEQERTSLASERIRLQTRRTELEQALRDTDEQLAADERIGEVPTEDRLSAAREERDRIWNGIRARGAADASAAEIFERAQHLADEIADRLRREANRVARRAELCAKRERLAVETEAVDAQQDALAEREAAHEESWSDAWREARIEPHDPREMRAWLDQFGEVTDLAEELVRERMRLEDELREVEGRIERSEERAAAARRELSSWVKSWSAAVEPLGLDPDSGPEEANAVLDQFEALFHKVDDAVQMRGRIESIERDAEQFARDIEAAIGSCSPELAERPIEEKAAELHRRHVDARQLRADLAEVDAAIEASGEGATIAQLIDETEGVDVDDARSRLEEMEDELETLDTDLESARDELRGTELGLAALGEKRSADLAVEAEGHLARVGDLAARYLRARLAAIVLRREIERYREENQDPILRRASELFPRLTLSSYERLKVGVGDSDEPVLRCVRRDGTEVSVGGLSDGARDQLYLALRIASLERHAVDDEAVPFVLDDVLIHFDEPRSLAALEVLGALATRVQVLLFTHHRRTVELARQALGDRLREYELRGRGRSVPGTSRLAHRSEGSV